MREDCEIRKLPCEKAANQRNLAISICYLQESPENGKAILNSIGKFSVRNFFTCYCVK